MSYETLKESIVNAIKPNGQHEITGQLLQDTLVEMVDEMEDRDSTKAEQTDLEALEQTVTDIKSEAEEALAKKDGSYPQMSVGFAEHLVGDGTATEEEFSFRPTAGVDRNVETTTYDYDMRSNFAARIEAVKGNSVVWNQMVANSRFETLTNYSAMGGGTISVTDNVATITLGGSSYSGVMYNKYYNNLVIGHKYLFTTTARAKTDTINKVAIPYCLSYGASPIHTLTAQWQTFSIIYAVNTLTFSLGPLRAGVVGTDFNEGDVVECSLFTMIDLTQMFGAGNEPTTVEEFYSLLPKNVDLNAYNKGEIVDANYGAIKTTGFNQFNGTYAKVLGGYPYYLGGTYTSVSFTTEEGGTTEAITIPSNKLYTPSQNGYIYAEGSDICINLAWDEYASLNGTYAPYKPFKRDLSWVAQYFPNGMRRAGSVSDEIRFNSTTQKWEAVKNVEVRAYTSGDESDTTLTTDGTNTNYPLATPIVTDIEGIPNLDYDVADYGTEELVVADGVKSAPFLGDIIYTPNAEKTLWQVPDILKRLTALEVAVASATSTTTTE